MSTDGEPHLSVGERVTIHAWPFAGRTGRLARARRWLGEPAWVVELDEPHAMAFRQRATIVAGNLSRVPDDWSFDGGATLEPGQRVVIHVWPFDGLSGRLVRRSRWLLRPAWVVQLDEPHGLAIRGRTRVLAAALEAIFEG